jgi:hypothetical protein
MSIFSTVFTLGIFRGLDLLLLVLDELVGVQPHTTAPNQVLVGGQSHTTAPHLVVGQSHTTAPGHRIYSENKCVIEDIQPVSQKAFSEHIVY